MTIIQTVSPEQASGKVAQIYREIEQTLGQVPNAFRVYSSSPDLLEQQWGQIMYYGQHPTLSFPLLAMIRMLVSQENECEYCIDLNEAMLIHRAGLTPEQVAATKRDPAKAPIPERDRDMLMFVLKATKTPKAVASADLDRLRGAGWRDGEIMDAMFHGARNMAADVVLNAFKVESDF